MYKLGPGVLRLRLYLLHSRSRPNYGANCIKVTSWISVVLVLINYCVKTERLRGQVCIPRRDNCIAHQLSL